MIKNLDKTNVNDFVKYMAKKYKTKIVHKNDPLYEMIKWSVKMMGVTIDIDDWLSRCSFAIPGAVWLSFDVGEGDKDHLIEQVKTICHELEHIEQYKDDNIKFAAGYIFLPAMRAHYETEARHSEIEMDHFFGKKPNPYAMIKQMRFYILTNTDLDVSLKHLKMYDKTVSGGKSISKVAKIAKEWWTLKEEKQTSE